MKLRQDLGHAWIQDDKRIECMEWNREEQKYINEGSHCQESSCKDRGLDL